MTTVEDNSFKFSMDKSADDRDRGLVLPDLKPQI